MEFLSGGKKSGNRKEYYVKDAELWCDTNAGAMTGHEKVTDYSQIVKDAGKVASNYVGKFLVVTIRHDGKVVDWSEDTRVQLSDTTGLMESSCFAGVNVTFSGVDSGKTVNITASLGNLKAENAIDVTLE